MVTDAPDTSVLLAQLEALGIDVNALMQLQQAADAVNSDDLRANGGVHGVYIRPDGQPAFLPTDPYDRDRFERQGFVFKREYGEYQLLADAGLKGRVFSALAKRFPEFRAARALMYKRSDNSDLATRVCACGLEFGNAEAYALHQDVCDAQPDGAAEAAPAVVSSAADTAAPARTYVCRQCGQPGFTTTGALGFHTRMEHPKPKRGKKTVTA